MCKNWCAVCFKMLMVNANQFLIQFIKLVTVLVSLKLLLRIIVKLNSVDIHDDLKIRFICNIMYSLMS